MARVNRPRPDYCYDSGCPLAEKGHGFVLDCGDPTKAKIALLLEAPGQEELIFRLEPEKGRRFYETQEECDAEIAIRKRDFPDLDPRFWKNGVPVCGKSGFELVQWTFPAAGLRRSDFFIANSLRCLAPKQGDSHYPKGKERQLAEAKCRYYDRWDKFKPDVALVSLHPAAIVREPTPLWLQVKNFEKARDFVKQGYKVLVLAGGKAVKWWLGYGENVTRWQGSYQLEDSASRLRRAERLEKYGNVVLGEKTHGKRKSSRPKETNSDRTDEGSTRTRGRRLNAVEALFGDQ